MRPTSLNDLNELGIDAVTYTSCAYLHNSILDDGFVNDFVSKY